MVVQHNLAAMEASRQLSINTDNRAKRSKNLSSGYRINSAADDAANLCISEKMRSQIRGLNRGSQNAQDGISMLQTGDAALSEVHEILQRICELSVQAANDTNTAEERSAIQEEINELKIEINDIGKTTEFNGIKIFKPTEAPDISGSPWDILVYREDYIDANGKPATREGGIIYNGIRYAYANMNLEYDDNDDIKAGTYDVVVEGENGDPVVIKLMFDGNNRIPSGREYELEPDYNGITIDGILHKWTDMTYESGGKFNPNNIHEGTISFEHAGLTITIPTENGMDIDDIITSLEEEGLLSYTLKSNNPVEKDELVTPTVSFTSETKMPDIKTDIEDLIPAHYDSITGQYKMYADNDGIRMFIPADEHCGTGEVQLTFKTWEELGIFDEDFNINSTDNDGINDGNTVTEDEKYPTSFTYRDDGSDGSKHTGFEITFTIDSEASKSDLIKAINAWEIKSTPTTTVNGTYDGNKTPTNISVNLTTYGTLHYQMGFTADQINQSTILADTTISQSGDALSFDMTDANGITYTMKADVGDIAASLESTLRSYLYGIGTAYQNELNGNYSTYPGLYGKQTMNLKFTDGTYSVTLPETKNADNLCALVTKDSFNAYITQQPQSGKFTININSAVNDIVQNLSKKINDEAQNLASNISGKPIKLTVGTTTNPLKTLNTISSDYEIPNIRYSSTSEVSEDPMHIQLSSKPGDSIRIDLPKVSASLIGLKTLDVSTHEKAGETLSAAQNAISVVSAMRSSLGTTQNRLEFAQSVIDNTAENVQASESLIRDADMAYEMVEYSKNNILAQAAQSVLAQANELPSGVLNLLK